MKNSKLGSLSTFASIAGAISVVAIAMMAYWVPDRSAALSFWIMLALLAVLAVCICFRVVCSIIEFVGKA